MNPQKNNEFGRDVSARNMLDKLGITELLNTGGNTEVLINRPYEIWTESSRGFERFERPELSLDVLRQLGNILAIYNQKNLAEKTPMHSLTLPDGERGHVLIPPSCEEDTIVYAFRKPSSSRFTLDSYIDSGRLTEFKDMAHFGLPVKESSIEISGGVFRDMADKYNIPNDVYLQDWQYKMLEYKANRQLNDFFQLAVKHHLNICMVGATGSGKTTFTKAIADMIPLDTRILTIEDTHELSLPLHPNHAHLFFKEHITAKALVAACMRLKPDRIFLTELRGDEAWDYLSALNTGHSGGLTSVHANDCLSVHYRIAQLAKESATGQTMDFNYILNTVRSTIDVICFFNKTYMTELYFDPVAKFYAMAGRS